MIMVLVGSHRPSDELRTDLATSVFLRVLVAFLSFKCPLKTQQQLCRGDANHLAQL